MTTAAVLSALHMMLPGNRRRKPNLCITIRKNVVLHAHGWHKEIVDYVLRRHQKTNRLVERYVQLVDGPVPIRIFELPHPLLCRDPDFLSVSRCNRSFQIPLEAPEKDKDHEDQRNNGPDEFKQVIVRPVRRHITWFVTEADDGI